MKETHVFSFWLLASQAFDNGVHLVDCQDVAVCHYLFVDGSLINNDLGNEASNIEIIHKASWHIAIAGDHIDEKVRQSDSPISTAGWELRNETKVPPANIDKRVRKIEPSKLAENLLSLSKQFRQSFLLERTSKLG